MAVGGAVRGSVGEAGGGGGAATASEGPGHDDEGEHRHPRADIAHWNLLESPSGSRASHRAPAEEVVRSATVFRDERPGRLRELGQVKTLEVLPCREARRVFHSIDEELAVEVVDFVLVGAGGEPLDLELESLPLAIPCAQAPQK